MDEMMQAAVAMTRAWKAAFEARDLDRLTALYAPRTAFYGSTAAFYDTPAGVRTYFELLPPAYRGADFATPHIVQLGPDAFAATGEVTFHRDDGADAMTALPFRITHVLVRDGGAWKIATHHASPRPPQRDGDR